MTECWSLGRESERTRKKARSVMPSTLDTPCCQYHAGDLEKDSIEYEPVTSTSMHTGETKSALKLGLIHGDGCLTTSLVEIRLCKRIVRFLKNSFVLTDGRVSSASSIDSPSSLTSLPITRIERQVIGGQIRQHGGGTTEAARYILPSITSHHILRTPGLTSSLLPQSSSWAHLPPPAQLCSR